MPRLKLVFQISAVLAVVAAVAAAASLVIFTKPQNIEKQIIRALDAEYPVNIRFQNFKLDYFPSIAAKSEAFAVESRTRPKTFLRGKSLKVYLHPLYLLVGKLKIAGVEANDAELSFSLSEKAEPVFLSQAKMKLKNAARPGMMRLDFHAAYGDVPHAVDLTADINIQKILDDRWADAAIRGELKLKDIILPVLGRHLDWHWPFSIHEGKLSSVLHFEKNPKKQDLSIKGQMALKQMVYQMLDASASKSKSPAFDADWDLDMTWDPMTNDIYFERASVDLPIGKIDIRGRYAGDHHEVQGLRITATKISVESISVYVLPFKDVIPVNVGFSGLSELEMSLEGTGDHLALHGNWNLNSTLLSYGRFFAKPKDLPLDVSFDLIMKDAASVSGDLSVRIQDATLKGSLKDFEPASGKGEFNLLTNKFKLNGWEKLLPVLKDAVLGGEMKLFMNIRGGEKGIQNMLNLTVEQGSLEKKDGIKVKDVELALDYGQVALEIKKAQFQLEDSPVQMKLLFHNLQQAVPVMKGEIQSKRLDPKQLKFMVAFMNELDLPLPLMMKEESFSEAFERILAEGEPFLNLDGRFRYEAQHFWIDSLDFEAYGGPQHFQLDLDLTAPPLKFWLNGDVRKLNLAQYFKQSPSQVINGNLFSTFQLSGEGLTPEEWQKTIRSEGVFSVTNGEFNTFDILGAVGRIEDFEEMELLADKKTMFDDLKGSFSYRKEKIEMKNVTLSSQNLFCEAQGEAFPDGRLNYRVDTYLSSILTDHFLSTRFGSNRSEFKNKQFGPIPLLLSGPLTKPDLKPDDTLLARLKEDLMKKRTQKVLRNFLPEETLFEPSKKP